MQEQELAKAAHRAIEFGQNGTHIDWLHQDFFAAYTNLKQSGTFDLVVGTPPIYSFSIFQR